LRGFRDVVTDPKTAAESRRPESYDYGAPPPSLPPAPSIPPPEQGPLEPYGGLEPQAPPENLWVPPLDGQSAHVPVDFDRAAGHVTRPPLTGGEESEAPSPPPPRRPRSYSGLIRLVLVLVLLGAVGGAAYWQRDAIGSLAGSIAALVKPSQPARETATPPARAKITDRIGQPAQQPSAGLPVAQRVVLYEEDPADTQGKRYVGTVLWRTEMKPAAPGRPPELMVRADIEVPERKMATGRFRNTDVAAGQPHHRDHVQPAGRGGCGRRAELPGVLMKRPSRSMALAGRRQGDAWPFRSGHLARDRQEGNIQLLKERSFRHSGGHNQPPRHPGDGEGHAGRAGVRRGVRGLERVSFGRTGANARLGRNKASAGALEEVVERGAWRLPWTVSRSLHFAGSCSGPARAPFLAAIWRFPGPSRSPDSSLRW
jgi:hypothetical protein